MVFKKPTTRKKKPVMEDKENNIRCQIWKNKSPKGNPFILVKFFVYKFPFKYTQTLTINLAEIKSLKALLDRMPEIKIKEKDE